MAISKFSAQLPIDAVKNSTTILNVVFWCRENFGAGNFGKKILKRDLCYWSFYYGSEYHECVLFNFSTQQQLNWFTLKWL